VHVVRMGEMREIHAKFQSGDLRVNGKITLEFVFGETEWESVDWCMWFRIVTSDGVL